MKKKLGIIIEVRTGSKRFPYKCLKKINNKTILEILINRIKHLKKIKIVIATTKLPQDDVIEKIAKKNKINIYRGSANDLVERVSNAAILYKIDHIIQLTADNPLIDLNILKQMIYIYSKKNYDFVSNSIVRSFPIGTDIRIFTLKSLLKISKIQKKKREHTCYYYLKNIKKFKTYNYKAIKKFNRPDIRLTIDFKEDLKLIREILKKNKDKNINLENVINILDQNPRLKKINSKYSKNIIIT